MVLWREFIRCVAALRTACKRNATYIWMMVVLVAWAARPDLLGVTSFVRASFVRESCYRLLLHFFHSSALVLSRLLEAWIRLAMSLFKPVKEAGYTILVADGLKVAKEGRKMPAVKCLHQESTNNTKPELIMGHSIQVVSMLVQATTGQAFAVPLVARICEGLRWGTNQDKKSIPDKLADMVINVGAVMATPMLLVADAYYANAKVILPLLKANYHLISRVRKNTVAFEPVLQPQVRKRGRPRIYGRKIYIRQLFKAANTFISAPSPVYGEKHVVIKYRCIDLVWRPVGRLVRFVLVKHPTRGMLILLSTETNLDPLAILKTYGLRFKIEVSFKQALHTIGAYAYHFWMMDMKPIKWGSKGQSLTNSCKQHRLAVERKLAAYHRYMQLGCIVQGLLQHLAINFGDAVWTQFRSWLRTMRPNLVPSELVVAHAMKTTLPEFLLDTTSDHEVKKFILDRVDFERLPGFSLKAA